MGGSCPDGCFELPVVTGCGTERTAAKVCTDRAFPVETTSCGFRQEDALTYHVDAPFEWDGDTGELIPNPFATIDGFRSCSQNEVDASDCRERRPQSPSAGFWTKKISSPSGSSFLPGRRRVGSGEGQYRRVGDRRRSDPSAMARTARCCSSRSGLPRGRGRLHVRSPEMM